MSTKKELIDCIYYRHAALACALSELADAMRQGDEGIQEALILVRIERVLEAHDSTLYADVASGRTDLATAINAALTALTVKRVELQAQLLQLDTDNARLTAELRTVRSWSIAPSAPDVP